MNGFDALRFSSAINDVEYGATRVLHTVEIVGYILIVLLVIAIVYLTYELVQLKEKHKLAFANHFVQPEKRETFNPQKEHWNHVVEAFSSNNPQLWRIGIIEADTMLENLIDSMGYQGATSGDKLKQITRGDIPWIDAAWDVHRLRNVLAHEGSRYPLNEREAYRAYKIYESIFFETGFLS